MKQTVRGRKKPGRRSDDKTKYARLLAIPATIVLVLLIVIWSWIRNREAIKIQRIPQYLKLQIFL